MRAEDKRFLRNFAEWLLMMSVLSAVMFFAGRSYERKNAAGHEASRLDTVTRIVTVYKDFPKPQETALSGFVSVPAYKFITDTVTCVETAEIAVHDTTVVYLPRERKYYEEEDGRLRLWVSGYDPSLDRYEISWPETTVTRTVLPRRWSLGVTAGYGAALHDKTVTLSPFVGFGVNYAIFSF